MENSHNTVPSTTGKRIKDLRKKRGLSQQALADFLMVDKSVVSRWENDDRRPSQEMLDALAKELETTPYYLMYGLANPVDANLLDLNGLTFRQMDVVKQLVEVFRGN